MRGNSIARIIGMIIAGIAIALVIGLALGWIVMALWNWLMPEIFGLPEIGYLQAVGLFVLAHLLLKGGGPFGHKHESHNSKHTVFKEKLRRKFCSDEEDEEPDETRNATERDTP